MQARKRRVGSVSSILLLLVAVVLLACGWVWRDKLMAWMKPAQSSDVPAALANDALAGQDLTLKIHQLPMDGFWFEYKIKKPFLIRHPSIRFTTATLTDWKEQDTLQERKEKLLNWLEKEQPDIVQLPLYWYSELAAEGRLKSLESYVQGQAFDADSYHKPLLDLLRTSAGGELSGVTTHFYSEGLFLNEDKFRQAGVPLPEGPLTAQQILELAARFNGTGITGLLTDGSDRAYVLTQWLGEMSGLRVMSKGDTGWQAAVHTEAWGTIWQKVADGYKAGWIMDQKAEDTASFSRALKDDIFARGDAAMLLTDSLYLSNLAAYEQKQELSLAWSTVAIQPDESAENQGRLLQPATVYAIYADSPNTDAAWEVLRFIAGGELAKQLDRGEEGQILLARGNNNKSDHQLGQLAAFYQYDSPRGIEKIVSTTKANNSEDYFSARERFMGLAKEQMKAVIAGSSNVESALTALQQQADAALRSPAPRKEQQQ